MFKNNTVTIAIIKNGDNARIQWFYDVPKGNYISIFSEADNADTIKVFDNVTGEVIARRDGISKSPVHTLKVTESGKLKPKAPSMQKQSNSTFDAITSGKFLTVQWVKKNGEVSTHSARFGVKKYLKSKDSKTKHDQEKHILVWCREQGGLRFNQPRLIARDSILAIKAEGYRVEVNISSPWAKMITA